ncbi:exosortase F system-associated membrane protein [Olleya marilimosa]|uniref:exosortase F system-associated membrane protein n=1 Tax=Olleya marilimosa TaxID=272164 RepID=UPI000483A0D8|nr:exosortase F system-associated protein [Olleya marilimosa]MBD3892109.1 exosortase F system-associated protein [Olleya marilimosa]PIB33811.1 exosortase F system-associated protein [Gaetbulibacter sp. 5U11]
MTKFYKYLLVAFLFILLALIRWFENELFYDPYLLFFHNDYLYMDSPRQEVFKLVINTSFRYLLNTILSLVILYVFFKEKSLIKFSSVIYLVSYILLIVCYLYFVLDPKQENYYIFFNLRRFLIQPIILLLLFPAFYYNKLRQ